MSSAAHSAPSPPAPLPLPPPPKSLQLDATLIDEALYSLFLPKLQNLFHYFSSSNNSKLVQLIKQEDVLLAIFQCCVLLYTSVGSGDDTPVTPAMSTLGLKMVPSDDDDIVGSLFSNSARLQQHQRQRQRHGDSLDRNRRKRNIQMRTLCFITCSTILPMIYKRLQRKLYDMHHTPPPTSSEETTTTTMEQRARNRQRKLLEYTVRLMHRIVPTLRVMNYLAFLSSSSSANSAPATFAMRISGLSFANSNHAITQQPDPIAATTTPKGPNRRQHVNFSFAYRRLLFEEMIRTLIQILPMALLVSTSANASSSVLSNLPSLTDIRASIAQSIRQRIYRIKHSLKLLSFLSNGNNDSNDGDGIESIQSLPLSCVICSTKDITIPYISRPCKHAFCYTCLRQAVTDNLKYHCPECGTIVQSSYRF